MTGLETLLMSDGELWVLLALVGVVGAMGMSVVPPGPRRDRLALRITLIAALAIAATAGFADWSAPTAGGRAFVADASQVVAAHR